MMKIFQVVKKKETDCKSIHKLKEKKKTFFSGKKNCSFNKSRQKRDA